MERLQVFRTGTAAKAGVVSLVAILIAGCVLGACGDGGKFVVSGSFASSDAISDVIYGEPGVNPAQMTPPLDGDRFSISLDRGRTYFFSLKRGPSTVGGLVFCDGEDGVYLAIPSSAGGAFDFGLFSKFTPARRTGRLGDDWAPQNRPAWLNCSLTPSTESTGQGTTPSMQRCSCGCQCENCVASTEGQLANAGQRCADLCPTLCASSSPGLNCGFWQGTVLSESCVPEPNP